MFREIRNIPCASTVSETESHEEEETGGNVGSDLQESKSRKKSLQEISNADERMVREVIGPGHQHRRGCWYWNRPTSSNIGRKQYIFTTIYVS